MTILECLLRAIFTHLYSLCYILIVSNQKSIRGSVVRLMLLRCVTVSILD